MIGETHLKNDINDDGSQISGFTLPRCDYSENVSRG